MNKEQYKEEVRLAVEEYKTKRANLKKRFKTNGFNCIDELNSIYVLDVCYKINYTNIRKYGLFRLLYLKLSSTLKYRKAKMLRLPARLDSPLRMPYTIFDTDLTVGDINKYVMKELAIRGEELLKIELAELAKENKNAKTEES